MALADSETRNRARKLNGSRIVAVKELKNACEINKLLP